MASFKEDIYRMCTETNFKDPTEAQVLAEYLARQLMLFHKISAQYEAKLKEIMSAKDYDEFTTEVGKQMYRNWVNSLPDSPFKTFVLENEAKILMEEEGNEGR